MKRETANTILTYAIMKCPLCITGKEKYDSHPAQPGYFRTKANLRLHIKRHHTEVEAEEFIKKND